MNEATHVTGEIPNTCLDLESDAHASVSTSEPAMYETIYITSHKQPCRALAFATDGSIDVCTITNTICAGSLVASGSADCSIKVVDVDRIIARDMTQEEIAAAVATGFESDAAAVKLSDAPVVRTLYDHTDVC